MREVTVVLIVSALIGIFALYGLLKPISNGCKMTRMNPTYVPISTADGVPSAKYGLYLYHEGDEDIDFNLHLKQLSGIPLLFIPGNAGSYKQILDQYKESRAAREKGGGAAAYGSLPKSVILVGHSMGGFVARAALIHPCLRKAAVDTVLTLSTPHQSPPVALQPSLGHYYSQVNEEWRKGYEVQTTQTGHNVSDPLLSHVVVVSISGGYNDYQVRSKLESLDGIVPPTNGFLISSTGMKNVWLSIEHQAILWCNQLVVQVSHTLLSLIDSKTGQPFPEANKRLAVFARMLRSGIPQSFNWMSSHRSTYVPFKDVKDATGSQVHTLSSCPNNVIWNDDGVDRDLHIQTTTMTVLAVDGRRRWLDIHKLGSDGKGHFMFVTNLGPCFGVRLHLRPDNGKSASEMAASKRVLEVTAKLVQIPSGQAPRQIEPGSETKEAPPFAVLWLSPEDMRGFRFLTISVAPSPTISAAPVPTGQFLNPDDGKRDLSAQFILLSTLSQKDLLLKEDHPLALNLSFTVSLGLLPISLSLMTTGCGTQRSGLLAEEVGDMENSRPCKLRCFPPIALAWDYASGLHIFPNFSSETIMVDSTSALWSSTQGSEKTTIMLLVDPSCSYKARIAVSATAAASRFLLLYSSQIVGFTIATIFFALMQQEHARDLDMPIPSMLKAVASNLRIPSPFLHQCFGPILVSLLISLLMSQPLPPLASFTLVSTICYVFANGSVILLVFVSRSVLDGAASIHVSIKRRLQELEGNICLAFLHWFINLQVVRVLRANPLLVTALRALRANPLLVTALRVLRAYPLLVTALTAITLGCLVHPALGLFILLLSHALCCDNAFSFTAYFRSHGLNQNFAAMDAQLEIFHHRHGLLILHLLAALIFVPSFVVWLKRIGMGHSFPGFLDSALCMGVILHGILNSKPELIFPEIFGREVRLYIYFLAGCYSYIAGLGLVPYRVFDAMAAIGFICCAFWILYRRSREEGEPPHRD